MTYKKVDILMEELCALIVKVIHNFDVICKPKKCSDLTPSPFLYNLSKGPGTTLDMFLLGHILIWLTLLELFGHIHHVQHFFPHYGHLKWQSKLPIKFDLGCLLNLEINYESFCSIISFMANVSSIPIKLQVTGKFIKINFILH